MNVLKILKIVRNKKSIFIYFFNIVKFGKYVKVSEIFKRFYQICSTFVG